MNKCEVIAHRGYSRQYPENTLLAFEEAVKLKADMLELDITLTEDGEWVVIHDDTLNRTTNGEGFIGFQSLEQVRTLDAGRWKGQEFKGQKVPTLGEVLDLFGNRISMNIEFKPFFPLHLYPLIETMVIDFLTEIHDRNLMESVVVSSTNFYLLKGIRNIDTDIRLGVLYRWPFTDIDPEYIIKRLNAYSFHPYFPQVTKEMVKMIHGLGAKVYPYTVNKRKHMLELLELGVDGMFTDTPERLQRESKNFFKDFKNKKSKKSKKKSKKSK